MNKNEFFKNVEETLKFIYEDNYKEEYLEEFSNLLGKWEDKNLIKSPKLTEENVYLITYGDSIYKNGEKTLETLNNFLKTEVKDTITDVHILPMFTYTSDDGFSVVDYLEVDKNLGTWKDVSNLSKNYRLMFDFVANHISKSSEWFKGYLNGDQKYNNYFIPKEEGFDYSKVVRPRTSDLFHKYESNNGIKTAWTTFSEDQVDVNFKHFPVLLEMTNILLEYIKNGATSIRLDAIGFIWKETGTTCIHLDRAHSIIKLWRLIIDYLELNTQIITETNVPHKENISYLGNGLNEANMVYQFSLPPLVFYTFLANDSTKLTNWAKTIEKISDKATYFNFLSSHDGIGLRPTEGILTDEEREKLVLKTIENGGLVSYKNNADGTKSVYELNINYNDAIIDKNDTEDQEIQKILASQAILLSFIGVPAIYYHSLLGSRNYYEGVKISSINRRINREKLEVSKIKEELTNDKRRNAIFNGIKNLIDLRKTNSAFSPYSNQTVLELSKDVFALQRFNEDTNEKITFILNVSKDPVKLDTDIKGIDIISNTEINGEINLKQFNFMWIK